MSKADGFLTYTRVDPLKRPVAERLKDYAEFEKLLSPVQLNQQANRCMDCGIPYCHNYGCPVHNRIPEWIDMAYRGRWHDALDLLHDTDNFPEVTGRVCPAPCEAACTLSINQPAVSIRHIELQIIERGFAEGWIKPEPAPFSSGRKVAVIGSGPAGLAAAQQLARYGHAVTVFEKDDRVGGLLRYGIPDFKLEKIVLDRRLQQMIGEGVRFETGVDVGVDLSGKYLRRGFDAIVLTLGAGQPRDLSVPGRQLRGVVFAMDYLAQQNRRVAGDAVPTAQAISAQGKHVVVIGGGDTGSDCIGTANRQGALSVTQLEILPQPADVRPPNNPWPTWPRILRSTSSHEEGCRRHWSAVSKEFLGASGYVSGVRLAKLDWPEKCSPSEIDGSQFELPADLVVLAMGFTHVRHTPLLADLNLELDERGNIKVDADQMTSAPGVFAAGDAVAGASLVVSAIHRGREAARMVDEYLGR